MVNFSQNQMHIHPRSTYFLLKNGSFRKPGRITVGLPSNLSTFFQRSKIWADEFAVRGTVVAKKNRLTSVCRLIFSSREALFKVRLFSVVTMVYRVVVSLIFFFSPLIIWGRFPFWRIFWGWNHQLVYLASMFRNLGEDEHYKGICHMSHSLTARRYGCFLKCWYRKMDGL